MGRPARLDSPVAVHIQLPGKTLATIDSLLYSKVEGRRVYGARSTFFAARAQEFFERVSLDLSPFLGTAPGTFQVWGQPAVVAALEEKLKATTATPSNP